MIRLCEAVWRRSRGTAASSDPPRSRLLSFRITTSLIGEPTRAKDEVYYPLFDYVRAAAAIGVFISHSDRYGLFPTDIGHASVQIFFALSGFLIGGILLRSKREDIPRFYFNRSTRIWIPYALAILLLS